MSRFLIHAMSIPGVHLVERRPLMDTRGSLTRLFCGQDLGEAGWTKPVAQINETVTAQAGTLRGMHFQDRPSREMKLVMCLRGEIYDVAVDLRRGSETFLCHDHAILSADNKRALLIPEGCAHGFQTLTDDVHLLYVHSAPYDAAAEGGVSPQDERLGIQWPQPVSAMSDRDSAHPRLRSDFAGLDP